MNKRIAVITATALAAGLAVGRASHSPPPKRAEHGCVKLQPKGPPKPAPCPAGLE